MNIPNLLTLFRIVASFAVLYYGVRNEWTLAFPIFCIAALTDMIDGAVARLLHQRTRLGSFLDPMADKLLMFFSFVALTLGHFLPLPLTILVIARDLLISAGILILKIKKIPMIYRPTTLSKMTTLSQIILVFTAMLMTRGVAPPFPIRFAVVVTALLTFTTALQYLRIGLKMLRGVQ